MNNNEFIKECQAHVENIAEELEIYADNGYKCPHCETVHSMSRYEESEHYNDADELCYTCPDCGGEIVENELEAVSLYDYFTDYYDIEYRIGSDRQLRSVCVMVACGGPNIYIDTADKEVQLFWGTTSESCPISSDAAEAVNSYFEEIYNCY